MVVFLLVMLIANNASKSKIIIFKIHDSVFIGRMEYFCKSEVFLVCNCFSLWYSLQREGNFNKRIILSVTVVKSMASFSSILQG